jgi:hypothetical protein
VKYEIFAILLGWYSSQLARILYYQNQWRRLQREEYESEAEPIECFQMAVAPKNNSGDFAFAEWRYINNKASVPEKIRYKVRHLGFRHDA